MSNDYQTVYDIAQQGFAWWFPALGICVILGGALILWVGKRNHWPWWRRGPGYVLIVFGLFYSVGVFMSTYADYSKVCSDYRQSHYLIVEGRVTDFRPMPYEGHRDECFSVESQTFCYSDFEILAGFHQSASHGGPIREGLPVRVSYTGDTIVRLEVRRGALASAEQRKVDSDAARSASQKRQDQNPRLQNISLGFAIGVVFMTLWWNLQWSRFMRFWVKPQNKPATIKLFRIFFAANLVGALVYLFQELGKHREPISARWGGIGCGAAMIAVIWIMVNAVEWMNRSHVP